MPAVRNRPRDAAIRNQPFFARQMSIVLENSGLVEPNRIESYIEAGGYHTLHHVLREMSPAQVVDEITKSGLRGRGGAGYPDRAQVGHGRQATVRAKVRRLQRR